MEDIVIDDYGSLPQLSRIEMPCFMKDKAKVLECFGGEKILMESLLGMSDVNQLHATLTPQEDPPRYTFQARPVTSNGFLLRIRRKKKQYISPGEISQPEVSVLGHVSKSFIFDRPVGYQFVRSNPSPPDHQVDKAKESQLEIAPHEFLGRYENLALDVFAAKAKYEMAGRRVNRQPYLRVFQQIKFEEGMVIPSPASAEENAAIHLRIRRFRPEEMNAILLALRELLEEHPLWTRTSMLEQMSGPRFAERPNIPAISAATVDFIIRQCMPLLCFGFLGGPWRGTCILRGFDPTLPENSHARLLQAVSLRYSTSTFASLVQSVSVGRVAGQRVVNLDTLEHDEFHPDRYLDNFQNVVIVAFGGVQITRQFYLQVRHLVSTGCRVEDEPHLASGMNPTGWFSEQVLASFRLTAKQYILKQATAFHEKHGALDPAFRSSSSGAHNPFELMQRETNAKRSHSAVGSTQPSSKNRKKTGQADISPSAGDTQTPLDPPPILSKPSLQGQDWTSLNTVDAFDVFAVDDDDGEDDEEENEDQHSTIYPYGQITDYSEI